MWLGRKYMQFMGKFGNIVWFGLIIVLVILFLIKFGTAEKDHSQHPYYEEGYEVGYEKGYEDAKKDLIQEYDAKLDVWRRVYQR